MSASDVLMFDRRVTTNEAVPAEVIGTVRLDFEHRQKRRARATISSGACAGVAVALDMPRGMVLRDGDRLRGAAHGYELVVQAAIQQLCEVRSTDWFLLTRVAYHLGNRHVPIAMLRDGDEGVLRLELDHVLEHMIHGLGASTAVVNAAFDPEPGAYGGHAHAEPATDMHTHEHGAGHPPGSDRDYDRRHSPIIHDFLDPNAPPVQR